MPFSQRPTPHLLIESQTLTIWLWNDIDLGVTLTLFMTFTSDKLKPSQTDAQVDKLVIFHEMTLTLTEWPWYDLDLIYYLDLRQVKPSYWLSREQN